MASVAPRCTEQRKRGRAEVRHGDGRRLRSVNLLARRSVALLSPVRAIQASLLQGSELYREVILDKLAHARESVLIATANVKEMFVEQQGEDRPYESILDLF